MRWAAAALVALGLVGVGGWYALKASNPPAVEYATAVGGRATVPLKDGSTVTLNTNSQVKVALSERARNVELPHGEAFFEVAKDSARPFTVKVAAKHVIAVGTKFSILSEGQLMRVSVTEGRVRIEDGKRPGPGAILEPGDVGILEGDTFRVEKRTLDALQEELSWREGYLIFHERTLGEAVSEFNRYNAQKITVTDPAIAEIKIGGRFRVANVDGFLRLMTRGLPIRVVRTNNAITLEKSA